MIFEEITTQEALEIVARSAMKHEYDKGAMIANAAAFRDAVIRRAVENEAAVPGTLRLAFHAAAKHLGSLEPVVSMPEAYTAWSPPDEDYEPCSPEERVRWLELIQSKLAGLDFDMERLNEVPVRTIVLSEGYPFDDDDIPGYGDDT